MPTPKELLKISIDNYKKVIAKAKGISKEVKEKEATKK